MAVLILGLPFSFEGRGFLGDGGFFGLFRRVFKLSRLSRRWGKNKMRQVRVVKFIYNYF